MIKLMKKAGLNSEVGYVAGMASVIASIVVWRTGTNGSDQAGTQRLAIFVGLWAPTFWEIGNALKVEEK